MTFSKTIAAFALTIFTLFAANLASAQDSYARSWESSNSWNSSWATGPSGTHSTYAQKSSQKSNESATFGGRTISSSHDHSQQSGIGCGYDQYGAYRNTYAKEQGKSVYTDINRNFVPFGQNMVQTRQLTDTYNNRRAVNQSWGHDGHYGQNGFSDRQHARKMLNRVHGTDLIGNRFGSQLVQEVGSNSHATSNQGVNRHGNRTLDQQSRGGSTVQKMNFRRW